MLEYDYLLTFCDANYAHQVGAKHVQMELFPLSHVERNMCLEIEHKEDVVTLIPAHQKALEQD